MVRYPVAAGKFYPGEKNSLIKILEKLVVKSVSEINCLGCILPHAGYIYSGNVAGKTIAQVQVKKTCIIIGPNHTGLGKRFSVFSKGTWRTPLADTPVDEELAKDLIDNCSLLEHDTQAHQFEHSIEVIVPFLQYVRSDVKIVPIIAGLTDDMKSFHSVAMDMAELLKKSGKLDDILIITSSDMTHMESLSVVEKKDKTAINKILNLDEQGLFNAVKNDNISMCGYIPAIIMLKCIKALGGKKAKLISYDTSASITNDYSSVVGYAGMTIERN